MAITVQRGPSMVDYGMAVAKAAEQSTANDRSAQYANYLAGIQKAGMDYGLGLGNLVSPRASLGLKHRARQTTCRSRSVRSIKGTIRTTSSVTSSRCRPRWQTIRT